MLRRMGRGVAGVELRRAIRSGAPRRAVETGAVPVRWGGRERRPRDRDPRLPGLDRRRSRGAAGARRGALRGRPAALPGRRRDHRGRGGTARFAHGAGGAARRGPRGRVRPRRARPGGSDHRGSTRRSHSPDARDALRRRPRHGHRRPGRARTRARAHARPTWPRSRRVRWPPTSSSSTCSPTARTATSRPARPSTTGDRDLICAAYAWADLGGADTASAVAWACLYSQLAMTVPTATGGAVSEERLLQEGAARGLVPPPRAEARAPA